MGLPKSVNILGTHYKVISEPFPDGDPGTQTVGEARQIVREIQVDPRLPADSQVEVFYHELVHTILEHVGAGTQLSRKKHELMAQSIGMALAHVVSNNKLPRLKVAK